MSDIVLFEIRNDKDRGNLILTVRRVDEDNVWFFQYQHQPITQHPENVQEIVRTSKPSLRTKTIKVNITDFIRHYWNGKSFEFKAVQLNSSGKQIAKVYERLANKEVGAAKRNITMKESKEKKLEEKNNKLREKRQKDEAAFQVEKAKRITELFRGRSVDMEQSNTK